MFLKDKWIGVDLFIVTKHKTVQTFVLHSIFFTVTESKMHNVLLWLSTPCGKTIAITFQA